jgi:hypothetical protein
VPDPSSVGEDATPQPQQKPRRNITMEDVPVRVKGAEHVIEDAPSTAEAVDRRHLATLRNKAAQMDTLRASVKRKKHTGSPLSKRLLALALVSVPGFSLTGAELAIPLIVAAFLADSNLTDDKTDLELFSKSFASASNLRNMLISSAS